MTLASELQTIANQVALKIELENPEMDKKEIGQLAKEIVMQMTIETAELIKSRA